MNINLTQIILAVIAVIGAIISTFVIPLLKAKLGVENDKLSENQRMLLQLAIKTAVTAAEQIYKSDEGQQKKAYVLGLLKAQGYEVDSAAIDAQIESIVLELHHELYDQDQKLML